MSTMESPKPVLKWAGGKQALATALAARFPASFQTYFEPFLGGASVLFEVLPKKSVAGDQNEWLIDTYKAIRQDYTRVAKSLRRLVNTRDEFLRIRAIDPKTLDIYTRGAHLIYLNKTCFRGLFRVNQKNQFNVPYGNYSRRYFDPDNLRAVASCLTDITLMCGDFETTIASAKRDDFVYFDPPYYKQGGYADFNRYTACQFRESDHMRLANVCRQLDKRGVKWAVSNSDTPFIRNLFDGFEIEAIANRREINLKSNKRGITELVIRNYNKDNHNT